MAPVFGKVSQFAEGFRGEQRPSPRHLGLHLGRQLPVVDPEALRVVDFGIGYGLTPGSDRWVAKTILSYAFPVDGKQDDKTVIKTPPTMKASLRQSSAATTVQAIADPFAGMR